MKRLLMMAAALLLLCGCREKELPGTTSPVQTTAPQQTQADLPGIYVPDSAAEQQSGGALQLYVPEDREYTSIAFRGIDPVLLWENGAAMYQG